MEERASRERRRPLTWRDPGWRCPYPIAEGLTLDEMVRGAVGALAAVAALSGGTWLFAWLVHIFCP